MQQYKNSPGVSHLRLANDHMTQYVPQVFQLAAMSRQPEAQEVISNAQKAFGSFSRSMASTANQSDERFNRHESELEAVREKSEELERALNALSSATSDKLTE